MSIFVTRHEKTGLMYTKYTYVFILQYVSPLLFMISEICKLHEIPYINGGFVERLIIYVRTYVCKVVSVN